jgi:Fuc2NAc and GlcNAc transferase
VAQPSARGLHLQPTPRGGGVIIALWGVLAMLLFPGSSNTTLLGNSLIITGLVVVALIGFVDDWSHDLPARIRLLIHLIASALVVSGSYISDLLDYFVVFHSPILVVAVFLTVVTAWSINAMNFMDGSDALVASQIVLSSLLFNVFGYITGEDLRVFIQISVVGVSTVAFLAKNFPPATMFLGDVGSGFLGLLIVTFVITTTPAVWWILPVALILYSLFIMDTILTLARRILRGERPTSAHREHAYQRIVQRSHRHQDALIVNSAYLLVIAVPLSALTIERSLSSVVTVSLSLLLAGLFVLLVPALISESGAP